MSSVREAMNTDVVTVELDTSMADLQRTFLSAQVGILPVLDRDDTLQGIVSRSDVVRSFAVEQSLAEMLEPGFDPVQGDEDDEHDQKSLEAIGAIVGRRLAKMVASDIMISKVFTIGPDASLGDAAELMLEHRVHRLPVIEGGRLVGIVSAYDFLSRYAKRKA